MSKKKSEQLNEALADAIMGQPLASVEAAIQELREAGLEDQAVQLEGVLGERREQLAEARAAKEREEAAERKRAIAAAQQAYDAAAAAYVVLRDEALAALEAYTEKAEPGMLAYRDMMFAANALDLLTSEMVQRPESAQAIFNRSDAFRKIQHNAFSSQSL